MSTSSMKTLPEVGLSSPPIMLKRVDLPEPEGPIKEMYSPRRMSRLTSFSAWRVSWPIVYSLIRFFVRTIHSCPPPLAPAIYPSVLYLNPESCGGRQFAGADRG